MTAPDDRRDEIPPLTPAKARGLLIGVTVFWLGFGIASWAMSVRHGFAVGWLIGAVGMLVLVLSGGLKFTPKTPRLMAATARVADLPAWPVTILAFVILIIGMVGFAHAIITGQSPR